MKKPRVAILHYSAPPIIGGVEATIGAHVRLLISHGYEVKIIAGRGEEQDPRVTFVGLPEIDSRHPRVEAVNRELNAGLVSTEFNALSESIELALADALADADVCLAHNVVTLHKNLALTAALYRLATQEGWRLVAWCHDFAWDDPIYAKDVHPRMPWDLMRNPWPKVKYVVVSNSRRTDLARLLNIAAEQIAVIPPGIDEVQFFAVTETTARWGKDLGLLGAAPLLLLPARVTRRKNIELAIGITGALRDIGLRPKLLVMGPLGPHNPKNRAYLDELYALRRKLGLDSQVIFLQEHGAVDDPTRRDLYALADALVFPSLREGFGIPMLEAGIARLPIFCTDIPAFRESAGEYAHYFDPEDSPAAIAARMADFFSNDTAYQLKQRVRDGYTWDQIFTDRIAPMLVEGGFK